MSGYTDQDWIKIASEATRAYSSVDPKKPETLTALESAMTAMKTFPNGPMTVFRDEQVKLCETRLANARAWASD